MTDPNDFAVLLEHFSSQRYRAFVLAVLDGRLISLLQDALRAASVDGVPGEKVTLEGGVGLLLSESELASILEVDEQELRLRATLNHQAEAVGGGRSLSTDEILENARWTAAEEDLQDALEESYRAFVQTFFLTFFRKDDVRRVVAQYKSTDEFGDDDYSLVDKKLASFLQKNVAVPEEDFDNALKVQKFVAFLEDLQSTPDTSPSDQKPGGTEFELLCLGALEAAGYKARLTPTADQGADIIAEKEDLSFAIQCKSHSRPIGNKAVQEVVAARRFYSTDYACVVANSSFTSAARELAAKNDVLLINED